MKLSLSPKNIVGLDGLTDLSVLGNLGEGATYRVWLRADNIFEGSSVPTWIDVFAASPEAAADLARQKYPKATVERVELANAQLPRINGRKMAIQALANVGGAVAGVKLWKAHPVWGGIIGFMVGGWLAYAVMGSWME